MHKIIIFLFCLFPFFSSSVTFAADECIWPNCIHKTSFKINVSDFTPGDTSLAVSWDSKGTVNNILGQILNLLIVAFWVFALFFMTIGAGYMIIYHGQDEFLSRGKSIFVAGLISLAVALSAGMIVKFVAYLLYQ